jgi:hypothetical protein
MQLDEHAVFADIPGDDGRESRGAPLVFPGQTRGKDDGSAVAGSLDLVGHAD